MGATAVETALTMPLFILSIFTVFLFMIAGYRSVALQLLTSEIVESLAVGSVCESNINAALATKANDIYVPLSSGKLTGYRARPGFTQPIFSLTLESTMDVPVFGFHFRMYGIAFGVAEETAC